MGTRLDGFPVSQRESPVKGKSCPHTVTCAQSFESCTSPAHNRCGACQGWKRTRWGPRRELPSANGAGRQVGSGDPFPRCVPATCRRGCRPRGRAEGRGSRSSCSRLGAGGPRGEGTSPSLTTLSLPSRTVSDPRRTWCAHGARGAGPLNRDEP